MAIALDDVHCEREITMVRARGYSEGIIIREDYIQCADSAQEKLIEH